MPNEKEKNVAFDLTDEEIIENLRTDVSETIDAVYNTCLKMLDKDDDRTRAIEAKGSTLLGMGGLSTGVVFSLGGILIEKITNIDLPIIGCPIPWLVLFYFTSSVTFLGSILFALLSLRARSDWKAMKDTDIFRADVLAEGPGPYKRYMATHAWNVYKNNYIVNEKKASLLKKGYYLFAAALFQLFPIICIIALYARYK